MGACCALPSWPVHTDWWSETLSRWRSDLRSRSADTGVAVDSRGEHWHTLVSTLSAFPLRWTSGSLSLSSFLALSLQPLPFAFPKCVYTHQTRTDLRLICATAFSLRLYIRCSIWNAAAFSVWCSSGVRFSVLCLSFQICIRQRFPSCQCSTVCNESFAVINRPLSLRKALLPTTFCCTTTSEAKIAIERDTSNGSAILVSIGLDGSKVFSSSPIGYFFVCLTLNYVCCSTEF